MGKGKFVDLTGQRFGRLVVQERAENMGKSVYWRCLCDCGSTKDIPGRSLREGTSRSCGCLQRDIVANTGHSNATHKATKTRLYRIWAGMKARCNRESHPRFSDYGGRGITVCQEWSDSFEAFQSWALEHGYQDNLTIDREDNDGPYCPENCRFASVKRQANNRRSSRLIEHNGRSMTLAQWSAETGVLYATLWRRLRAGWPFEKAIQPLNGDDN